MDDNTLCTEYDYWMALWCVDWNIEFKKIQLREILLVLLTLQIRNIWVWSPKRKIVVTALYSIFCRRQKHTQFSLSERVFSNIENRIFYRQNMLHMNTRKFQIDRNTIYRYLNTNNLSTKTKWIVCKWIG